MTSAPETPCPACHCGVLQVFYQADNVPGNCCILLQSRREALDYPRGDIRLGFCHSCGFISNLAFDPGLAEYSQRYEETQGFSPTFNRFHRELAATLVEHYGLHGKNIVEIGCGKGEFLQLLCELGENQGVGFDPGVKPDRIDGPAAERVSLVADFYSENYADQPADFLVCKMTLEHIHRVGEFVAALRRAIGERHGTPVFFQVPEASRILRECAFEDINYEHCSYFSPGSLARLFRANGFEVLRLSTQYSGQYLTLEARACNPGSTQNPLPAEDDIDTLQEMVNSFPERFRQQRDAWGQRLHQHQQSDNQKTVLWGAQSKAVAFLSTVPEAGCIRYGVDINPYRQGHFLPGSGLEIVAPEFLLEYRPDQVLVMNPIYREEIQAQLTAMGLDPEVTCL